MKKLIMITLLFISINLYAESAVVYQYVPLSFQGQYNSLLLSTDGSNPNKHMITVLCDIKDKDVIVNGKVYTPTTIQYVNDYELWLFFSDINRFWKIKKQIDNECLVIVEDTKKDIEIQRWLVEIK